MQESPSPTGSFTVKRINRLADINPADWDALLNNSNPFLTHAFLAGLENHGCLTEHGWQPCHTLVYEGNTLAGALPLYLKGNSYGEFVFDWSWADAYERAGGHYYPKLVSAIPFTPVRGARLLINRDNPKFLAIKKLLLENVLEWVDASALSSFHCLFLERNDNDFALLDTSGLLPRKTCQFFWHNKGYRDFQDFLETMSSKKRKQIRRERRQIIENDIRIERIPGDAITAEQWRIFYEFYCSTFYRRWGSPRLTYEFFLSLSRELPRNTLLILASRNNDYIAGAFSMLDDTSLYGRHWGCSRDFPYLHFELCYYQTIEHAIRHGLKIVDAGVQGEHKLSRGFQPESAISYHWIQHPGFRNAIDQFLRRESAGVDDYIRELRAHLPYKSLSDSLDH